MLSARVDAVPSPDPLGTNTCTATRPASATGAPADRGSYTSPELSTENRTHGTFNAVRGGVFGQQMGVVVHVAIRAASIALAVLSNFFPVSLYNHVGFEKLNPHHGDIACTH